MTDQCTVDVYGSIPPSRRLSRRVDDCSRWRRSSGQQRSSRLIIYYYDHIRRSPCSSNTKSCHSHDTIITHCYYYYSQIAHDKLRKASGPHTESATLVAPSSVDFPVRGATAHRCARASQAHSQQLSATRSQCFFLV